MNCTFTELTFTDGERDVMVHQQADGSFSRVYTYKRDLATMPKHWQVKTKDSINPLFVDILVPGPEAMVRKLRAAGFSSR